MVAKYATFNGCTLTTCPKKSLNSQIVKYFGFPERTFIAKIFDFSWYICSLFNSNKELTKFFSQKWGRERERESKTERERVVEDRQTKGERE